MMMKIILIPVRSIKWVTFATALFLLFSSPSHAETPAPDAEEITAAVHRFHEALTKGDPLMAMAMLTADAVILESGQKQTREEYAREHLAEDIAFMKATQNTISEFAVHQEGSAAWTAASSRTSGTFHDKPVNSAGTELMVLTKLPEGWRIRAIHWSSRKAPVTK